VKRLLAILLVFAAAGPAFAAELVVRVRSVDDKGKERGVVRAAVVMTPADAPVIVGADTGVPPVLTNAYGDASIGRPTVPCVVVATARGMAAGHARVAPGAESVTIVLSGEAVLAGVVLAPDGKPRGGATVTVTAERTEEAKSLLPAGVVGFRAVTGEAGRFEVSGLAAGRRYIIQAAAKGFAAARRRDVEPSAEGLSIPLLAGGTVRGRVFGLPGGKPLAGAEVVLADVAGRTDEQGFFELRGVPPGAWPVDVRAENYLFVEKREIVLADEEVREGLFLRLIGLGRLKGRVLTAATRPAPGATILLRYPPGSDLARRLPPDRLVTAGESGEDGSFDLAGLLPAQGVDLIVRHPDHAPTVHLGYSIVAGRTFRTIILLRDGGGIRGQVTDARGEGIEGARVIAIDDREDPANVIREGRSALPTSRESVTDEDGAFLIEHVPSGRRSLVAVKPGLLPAVLRGIDIGEGATREGIFLMIGEGARLSGTVRDREDRPIALAEVTAHPVLGMPVSTTSDEKGAFAFPSLPAGTWQVRAASPGFAPGEAVQVTAPAEDVRIILTAGTGFSGQVLIEDSSEPAAPARIRILKRGEASPLRPNEPVYTTVAETRAEPPAGTFSAGNLGPGTYRIEAWTDFGQYGFLDGVRVVAGDRPRNLEVRVASGWAIRGRVVDGRNGLPIESATVAIRDNSDRPGPHRAVTDGQGRFRIDAVPAGFHSLLVVARDMAPVIVRSTEVKTAADTVVDDIVLAPGPKVSGTVTGPEGEPRTGVKVSVASADLGGERLESTDEEGRFTFENVAPGDYILTADDSSGVRFMRRHERLITVVAGRDLDLSIGSGDGSVLMGHITASGAPVAHAKLSALFAKRDLKKHRHLVTTRTDAEGNYVFADMPVGPHLLTVTMPWAGGNPIRFPAEVLPGPVTILDLVLPDSGVEGTVYDLDTGDPLAGALLRLTRETGGAKGTFLDALTREMGEIVSDASGDFRFAALPAGDYLIEAFRDAYGRTDLGRIRVFPGGFTPVRLEMPPAGTLRGEVLDDLGRPVTTARVRFLDERGRSVTRRAFVEVDSLGRFDVSELRTGTYTVEVTADGFARQELPDVDVFPGGAPEVTVRLKIEGRLEVTVYGEAGVTLEGARISVLDFWGQAIEFPEPEVGPLTPWRDPSITDAAGRVRIAGLPPGIYTVTANLKGHRGAPVRIRVLDGELSRGAVVLLPAR
jgi:protocatechuate 3,4-dioxygenase beta subunit